MARLLYIIASPRTERSRSIRVAEAFLEAYCESNPADEVVTVDLFERELVPFDGKALKAKYRIMHGEEATPDQRAAWGKVEALIEEFTSAHRYLLATPMWNFNVPYRLKQYIDVIVQPTYTFGVTDEGDYVGLVTGKPMFVAAARGNQYPPGSEFEQYDLQKPYLETIFGFIGFEDIQWAIAQPTEAGDEELQRERLSEAVERARRLASDF
ncbi:MAG: FMN-dependent NADH-azoreductase [Planctomycetota bacterium]